MDEISFTKVKLPYGWLGNMAPYPIDHEGLRWRTSEALFQALRYADPLLRELIRAEPSPMAAKMVAKKHATRWVVEPRSPQDVANMRLVLRLKLEQHPELKAMLLNTGDAQIIEDCSARPTESGLFWGAQHMPEGWYPRWLGHNQLGKLWMALRAYYKENV